MGKKKLSKKTKGQLSKRRATVVGSHQDSMIRWLYSKGATLNGVMCVDCGAVLVSHTRHDFVPCFCPNETYVDGGQEDYMRVGGHNLSKVVSVKVTIERGDQR